jgi:hypothetical protein
MLHAWLPIIGATCVAIAVFVIIAIRNYRQLGPGRYATFTPPERIRHPVTGQIVETGQTVAFEPRHEHYLKVAEVITTLSSASFVFLLSLHSSHSVMLFPFAMVLLGFSIVYAVLFMALITYFYEQFLYDPAMYSNRRQSIIVGLGFGALLCFALAYFFLAVQVAHAYGQGTLILR